MGESRKQVQEGFGYAKAIWDNSDWKDGEAAYHMIHNALTLASGKPDELLTDEEMKKAAWGVIRYLKE